MRDAYREELAEITDGLEQMALIAASAIGRATTALLDADLQLAETVIAADDRLDQLQRDLEERAIAVLARQQPVATELRTVVTALRISAELERSGDLALNVAKLARRRFPDHAVPHELHATVLEMGHVAQRLMAKAADVIATRELKTALELEGDDDAMDDLHRALFRRLMDDRWQHGVEDAVDVTLAGRFYERFADHAVSVAKRVVYLVTGTYADDLPPQ
ncbi:phosphate transport system regulatory protein PhoU [Streptacidiphilus pinicola]|uniref:Phosphate-specific transport system accessory protein PhoU n=1 Tax=Streptacidiphilus pinicola TaxID=2219663 RepID=A0A2X0IGZ4_9ACTN|nr:phosphate signaling complex protein PhoU [Streptacidiphilus pinicola]RAG84294.1 phosphate transport system regulatory protein PhoU [Streptacidiphilus pinicola]